MAEFKINKVVGSLPATLTADMVYAVRSGVGFDLYIADSTGAVAHKVNGGSGNGGTSIYVGSTPPPSPADGQLWVQTI